MHPNHAPIHDRRRLVHPGMRGPRVAFLAMLVLAGACGGEGGQVQDPARARYEADRARCDSISTVEAARKSCMSYRGWPDGKFRR